jgi:hypothetical protein
MGRLTLNILLSFAQFEREVTGERIRDKIAASKRKGMWMGGRVPLGYDLKERRLAVNHEEAKLINDLYHRYLELGAVSKVKTWLDEHGLKSKERISPAGIRTGGASFSRGSLYLILQNPIYLGEVRHRNHSYPGEQESIVPRDLWDQVQAQLRSDNGGKKSDVRTKCSSLLLGLLQDVEGDQFRSSHTVKNGRRYRYYFLQKPSLDSDRQSKAMRLPAYDVERQVSAKLESFLRSKDQVLAELAIAQDHPDTARDLLTAATKQAEKLSEGPLDEARDFLRTVVCRVIVRPDKIDMELGRRELRASLTENQSGTHPRLIQQPASPEDLICLSIEARLKRFGGEMRLVVNPDSLPAQQMTPLLKAITRAHRWRQGILAGESLKRTVAAKQLGLNEQYLRRVLGCAFLAPDIVEAILDGRYPSNLSVRKLSHRQLPLNWAEQRIRLGFPPRESNGI